MADIRVAEVRIATEQPSGGVVPVRLFLNNLETVAPFWWKDGACKTDGSGGHKADVRLRVRGPDGSTIFDEEKTVCVPINRLFETLGANQIVTFEPEMEREGVYTLTGSAVDKPTNGTHTGDPVTVEVVPPEDAPRATDDESSPESSVGEEVGEELGDLVGSTAQETKRESTEQNTGGTRNEEEVNVGAGFADFVRNNPAVAAGVGAGGLVAIKVLF